MTNIVFRLSALGDPSLQLDRNYQPERLCHFAQVLMEKREFSMALERFDAALALKRDLAIAWAGRGQVLYYQRRYPEALRCLVKASQHLQSKVPILMLEQAKVLLKLGLFEAAADCCGDVLRLCPRHLGARLYWTYSLWKLQCYPTLIPSFLLPDFLRSSRQAGINSEQCALHFSKL